MKTPIVGDIIDTVGDIIAKAVPDRAERERLMAQLDMTALAGRVQIIVAEATGESWLQRNWRPLVMLWLMGLVSAYWLGYTPVNISEDLTVSLFGLVKIGLGGYVVGRSAEKVAKVAAPAVREGLAARRPQHPPTYD